MRDLTRSQLQRATDKADAAHSAILDEMIAAGRGNERPSETASKCDPLSVRFNASMARCAELQAEARRRMEHHGSLHRTLSGVDL